MSYTRPSYDAADASWAGASAYTRPDYDAADATFQEQDVESSDGRLSIQRVIGKASLFATVRADANLSISGVIGNVALLGTVPNDAALTVSRIIRSVQCVGTAPAPGGRLSVSRVVGSVLCVGARSDEARLSVSRIIGRIRVRGSNWADPWTAAGFLPPRVSDYTITPGHSLIRTKMESGATRQRARWTSGYHKCTIAVALNNNQIDDMESFLSAVDYDWFNMLLPIFGESGLHQVRVISDPSFKSVGSNLFDMRLELEVVP